MTTLVTACTTLPHAPPLSDAACASANVDVIDHDVDLAVTLSPPSLAGDGRLRLRARAATGIAVLDARALHFSEVSIGDQPLHFSTDDQHVCMRLPRALAPNEEVTLRLRWSARVDGETPAFSPSQAWAGYLTSAWMPTVQDPAQRSTLTLRVTAPEGLQVAASGRRGASRAGQHHFTVARPVPPFMFAFVVGDFDETVLEADGVRLRGLGPRGVSLTAALETTAAALRFLHERTGLPYPDVEYQEVFVRGNAAQEAAGLAVVSASSVDDLKTDANDDWIFSHELAHQWFGVRVPCADFSDFWLNEGFATFFVAAFKEHRQGRAAYERERDVWRARSQKVHAQGRDAPVSMAPPGVPRQVLPENQLQARGVTYFRGALVLDALRTTLGDDAFWRGIRDYVASRAGRSATTEDLRRALEKTSGRDLQAFFDTWVYRSAPSL